MKRRAYTQRRRAELQEATRLRIVEATIELHRGVGPAATTISAVAEGAGVQRHTVYRHFPDEKALLRACAGHFLATNPPPDPAAWKSAGQGLVELYRYYETSEQMIASVLRDSTVMPVGRAFKALQVAAIAALAALSPMGTGRDHIAILRLATDFRGWQALGLRSAPAAALMARLLECG